MSLCASSFLSPRLRLDIPAVQSPRCWSLVLKSVCMPVSSFIRNSTTHHSHLLDSSSGTLEIQGENLTHLTIQLDAHLVTVHRAFHLPPASKPSSFKPPSPSVSVAFTPKTLATFPRLQLMSLCSIGFLKFAI